MRKLLAAIYLLCCLVFCAGTNDLLLLGAGVSGSSSYTYGGITGWDFIYDSADDSPSTTGILKSGGGAASYTETIVTWNDLTPNGYDLTAAGDPVYTENVISTYDAPDLDATGDYFEDATGTAGAYDASDSFLAFVVFVPDNPGTGYQELISKMAGSSTFRGWDIIIEQTTGKLFFQKIETSGSADVVKKMQTGISADTLYIASVYWAGTTPTCYLDGAELTVDDASTGTVTTITNSAKLALGTRTSGANLFNGSILKAGTIEGTRTAGELSTFHTAVCSEFGKVC